ncbi:uncharacterized protein CIMG_04744 [Coccidioides immitis RS]|uniref:DUF1776-domain-containing protein n=4 Tax=Coccidioides immitis TaxID=5501 RepID=J3KE51_COCIM|nr:uncharacterized protein CIMG_04744 [Coccidioides immitis RS]EAS33720.3 hypothetical protein CIMG_04744 [Coccidioides immitis RS]KMP04910.1 hypothetical protein CIRG_04591 [Coccidioides immitis RMSCC 2394]KMU78106.1 hypothetical protein CISG_06947 [Coccidioides immitis RMSCC 3703]KMU86412.1 hypothetical protein CIHG_04201 [Coccidioides immitis H538.4]
MTSDDEFFFDYKLSWVPNDVKRYSTQVANSIDRHIDRAASNVRDALSRQSWLPTYLKPPPRHGQPLPRTLPPKSMVDRVHDWVVEHRALTAAVLAFIGTGGLLIYGNRKLGVKKRKARRAGNGARKEIVVIAGSAHEPITRSIACDLERRGFIVFITVTSAEEEHVVENEAREDIRSLWLDLANTPSEPSEMHPSLYVIQSLITNPQAPMPGVPPHTCQLTGLILVPSLTYPVGPVATIPASNWADAINTRLLYPILTAQLFLPLLTLKSNSSSIVLITPSIQSSLSSPFASPEVAVTRALAGFATSLRQELQLLESGHGSVDIVELKLGNLDLGRQFRNTNGQNKGTEVLTWQPQQRALYGPSYLSSIGHRVGRSSGAGSLHGTPAKELHFAVFDALAPRQKTIFGRKRKQQVVYVGRGSRTYAIVGNVIPSMLIGWMLGLRTGYPAFFSDSGSEDGNGYGSEGTWEKIS